MWARWQDEARAHYIPGLSAGQYTTLCGREAHWFLINPLLLTPLCLACQRLFLEEHRGRV